MAINDVEYIQDLGLHDAEIVKLEIDYSAHQILIYVVTFTKTKLILKFIGVTSFTFSENSDKYNVSPDFKNKEIILEHDFPNEKQFECLTASIVKYQIQFNEFRIEKF